MVEKNIIPAHSYGKTLFHPLAVIGAAVAVIIAHPDEKFRRGVLGKVVGQPLPVEADRETVL